MGRYNPPGRVTRKRTAVQNNKITKYLSPRNDKDVSVVRDNFEDLTLRSPQKKCPKSSGNNSASLAKTPPLFSPQKKRLKSNRYNSVSLANTPPVLHRSNVNHSAKNGFTSPIEDKPGTIGNIKTAKSSPPKSARVLFAGTPTKRKRPVEKPEESSPSKSSKKVDMNANFSAKQSSKENKTNQNHRRKKIDLSGEKFVKKLASNNPLSSDMLCEEPSMVFEKGTTKLVAFDCTLEAPSGNSNPREGLKLFKEIAVHVNSCFNNPEQRLKVSFPTAINQDVFSDVEPSCERQAYSESLMAVLHVDGFTDTGLDLIGNYLSSDQFLSWTLLRGIIYFSIRFCNEEDFSKTLKLCMHQLLFHPPGSDNMRDYYLALITQDEEIITGEKEKGLLNYLIEAFTNYYKYCSPSKAKRPKKKTAKYFDTSGEDLDEDENSMEVEEESDAERKRKGRKKKKSFSEDMLVEDIYDRTNLGVNSLEDLKEINDTLRSALNDVGKKNHIVISPETLLKRQLQILDFVVKILEVDFVQWSKRNSHCAREKLVSANETPLIAALLFDRQVGFSVVSARMKEIFYFFAISDEKHRKYFQRLIALMAEVMRIFEGEIAEDEDSGKKFIRYPYISVKCESFSDEFFSHCFQNTSSSYSYPTVCDEQIARLQSLEPAWLRLLIANRLLNQTLGAKLSGNLSSVIDVLKAFSYNDVTCSEELLQSSSVDVTNQHSRTQLTKLRSKKDINRKNHKGETPLHTACMRNKPSELKNYLLLPNVDIMVQDNNGWCPIHEAAVHGSVECCKLLCEHASTFESKSALVSCRSFDGSTPLMEAVSKNRLEVADYLLSVGGGSLLKHVNSHQESVLDLCESDAMQQVLSKYMDEPVKKFLKVPSQVWRILFTLISSYFETYSTELGLKYKNLNLSPADFNNVSFPNGKGGMNVSFLIDSSLYIKDLQVIKELRGWIVMLKIYNPGVKQLLALDQIFS